MMKILPMSPKSGKFKFIEGSPYNRGFWDITRNDEEVKVLILVWSYVVAGKWKSGKWQESSSCLKGGHLPKRYHPWVTGTPLSAWTPESTLCPLHREAERLPCSCSESSSSSRGWGWANHKLPPEGPPGCRRPCMSSWRLSRHAGHLCWSPSGPHTHQGQDKNPMTFENCEF